MMRSSPGMVLTTFLLIASSCGIELERICDEVRRGPENSFFVGGLDGGEFVTMAAPKPGEDFYHGKIFHEDGALLYAGPFRYSAPGSQFDPADPALYSGWDGERLFLRDNTYFTPTERIPPL